MIIEQRDVENAYRKLKSYYYHDNTSLFFRKKFAEFESNGYFEDSIKQLTLFLQNSNEPEYIDYFNSLLDKISFHCIPKRIELPKNKKIVTNRVNEKKYNIDKVTYLINAPVEIHIISALWILNIGFLLDSNRHDYLYGYKLEYNQYETEVVDGLKLFKPYFKQYQNWRDKGIQEVEKCLDNNTNIAMILLDIKNYYHSIEFSFEKLKLELEKYFLYKDVFYLNDLLEIIHKKYTNYFNSKSNELHSETSTLLPIGLLSSGVLANWYLNSFDRQVLEEIKPVYYGRYVDDIIIVIQNPEINPDGSNILNKFIIKYFIKDSKILTKSKDGLYQIISSKELKIQEDKIKLYLLDSNASKAGLKKFKKTIRENSSEFRFLPEEDLVNSNFDEEAYSIIYSDSINKLRSVEELVHDKYSASKYLSSKIFSSLKCDYDADEIKKTANQILSFFKGRLVIEFFSLWEKIISYFIINNLDDEFLSFIGEVQFQINKISYNDSNIENCIKLSLMDYLEISSALPISLNLSKHEELLYDFINLTSLLDLAKFFRKSNMLRHSYVFYPLFNYTNLNFEESIDFRNKHLDDYPIPVIEDFNNSNHLLIKYSPRFIHLHEVQLFFLYHKCINKSYSDNDEYMRYSSDESLNLYYTMNYHRDNNIEIDVNHRLGIINQILETEIENPDDTLQVNKFNLKTQSHKLDEIKIALANIKIDESNIVNSLNKPNLNFSRKQELYKLLNLVEKEGCDLFIFPELSIPYSWLQIIAQFSEQRQKAVVCGLEYICRKKVAYNILVTILPIKINGYKSVFIKYRLKNHYSPDEELELTKRNYKIPISNPYTYDLYNWRGLHFSCYNCFEFTDIKHRSIFKSFTDLIIAVEYNKDIQYFSNIVESVARDIHCYVIQVNNSLWGDSRITQPTSSETKDIIKIKGGDNNTILVGTIDVDKLRNFQVTNYSQQKNTKEFKPTPPDFSKENVKNRM